MKYEHTTKGIAALGRNGDDTLLHVNKDELAGLQALLGPVSVNPETGLPEAFNWSSILSSVGIGLLGALTGGAAAPALGALGATAVGAGTGALAGGALSAAQGKGFGPGALGGLISGGMGGFGGAGLGGAPTSAAGAAATPIPAGASTSALPSIAGATEQAAAAPMTISVGGPFGGIGSGQQVLSNTLGLGGAPGSVGSGAAGFIGPDKALGTSTGTLDAIRNLGGAPVDKQAMMPTAPTGSSYWDALKKQGTTMMTKDGLTDLLKPVGLGAVTGSMVQEGMIQDKQAQQQRQQAEAQAQANAQDQQNYFSSLGFNLPSPSVTSSPSTADQRNYYLNLVYPNSGYAAGGPITASRMVMGIPTQTTFPAKYVDEFERSNIQKEIPEAFQGLQQLVGDVGLAAQKADARRMANGGYLNNTVPPQEDPHPQSMIPKAAPHPGAAPVRQEVVQAYSDGGSVYDEGGFLDGPGDGMSDDIPANIDGQEEVRLADGEFVVPPEIVSMLGYGDPEKGAKLLDNLLPMVRQAAHGKKEQVKQDAAKQVVAKALGGLPQSGKRSLAAQKAETRKKQNA